MIAGRWHGTEGRLGFFIVVYKIRLFKHALNVDRKEQKEKVEDR